MIKFRSMARDADTRLAELSSVNEGLRLFKIKDDPRVTRVGHFIRRYSIDELPQLLNVVAGHMSPAPAAADRRGRAIRRTKRGGQIAEGAPMGQWGGCAFQSRRDDAEALGPRDTQQGTVSTDADDLVTAGSHGEHQRQQEVAERKIDVGNFDYFQGSGRAGANMWFVATGRKPTHRRRQRDKVRCWGSLTVKHPARVENERRLACRSTLDVLSQNWTCFSVGPVGQFHPLPASPAFRGRGGVCDGGGSSGLTEDPPDR